MRKFLVALIVPARLHEPVRIEEIGLCLASRQALVEGNVEAISGRGWHAFLNDQAKSIPLPLNPRAEVLIREAGTPIEAPLSGNAVFLGHGSDGDETDVPAQLLSLAERLFATRLAA